MCIASLPEKLRRAGIGAISVMLGQGAQQIAITAMLHFGKNLFGTGVIRGPPVQQVGAAQEFCAVRMYFSRAVEGNAEHGVDGSWLIHYTLIIKIPQSVPAHPH